MKEAELDVFEHLKSFDGLCIPSNGDVTNRGEAVMGRGVALLAKLRWPSIPKQLGSRIRSFGHQACLIARYEGIPIFSFPTKMHWRDRMSDIDLIVHSARRLVELADEERLKAVACPFPGIGAGGLDPEEVRAKIAPILGDNFVVLRH